jgi:CRISPR-associated endonuclease/helicase Cas3
MEAVLLKGFCNLTGQARRLWAKSGDHFGHEVLAHLLDVAAVAETILQHEPRSTLDWAARAMGLERLHVGRWIACMVGLHDFGKAIPGFRLCRPPNHHRGLYVALPTPGHRQCAV